MCRGDDPSINSSIGLIYFKAQITRSVMEGLSSTKILRPKIKQPFDFVTLNKPTHLT